MSAAREWSTSRYPFAADEAQEARAMLARVLAFERSVPSDPELRRRITELEQQVLKLRAALRAERWAALSRSVDRG